MKKCKNCNLEFAPRFNSLEKYCWDEECKLIEIRQRIEKQKKLAEKKWNKDKKVLKRELMSLSDYLKHTQVTFNKFIRLRDLGQNCISCNKKPLKENAGHYYNSALHYNVRFDEENVNLQCEYCNTFLSGNLINYRIGLIKKIGIEKFESLENRAKIVRKFTKNEVIEIENKYKILIKKIKNE